MLLLGTNYLVVSQWQGFLDSMIWIVVGVMMMLIGTGQWVRSERRKSLWQLFKQSLAVVVFSHEDDRERDAAAQPSDSGSSW